MRPLRRMELKREAWRKKAVERAIKLRAARREIRRLHRKIDDLKKEVPIPSETEPIQPQPVLHPIVVSKSVESPVVDAKQIRSICVLLAVYAFQSFRSIPRSLVVLSNVKWVPHFASVINWTLEYGLGLLQSIKPIDEPWIAIIDMSINKGIQKVMVVLRVRLEALEQRISALTLEDAECIGLAVSSGWNGKKIADALESIFLKAGYPIAIIKDQGTELDAGTYQWRVKVNRVSEIQVIDDVGHVAANALKAEIDHLQIFHHFLKQIYSASNKLRQTELFFLVPTKLGISGRFLRVPKFAKWTTRFYQLLSAPNLENSKFKRLLTLRSKLIRYQLFVNRLTKTCETVDFFLKLLKHKGLDQNTFKEASSILERLSPHSKTRIRLSKWLNLHLSIREGLHIGDIPLPVSSDIVESLLAKLKNILARNPLSEFNRLILTVPALCGHLTVQKIDKFLQETSYLDLKEWIKANIQTTECQMRRAFNHGWLMLLAPKSEKKFPIPGCKISTA
jgi:hypothetical protein